MPFTSINRPALAGLVAGVIALGAATGAMAQAPWFTMPDEEFAETYARWAFDDDLQGQGRVAWMLWARVNRQIPLGDRTVSLWELWPSDQKTFSPGAVADGEPRDRLNLVVSKALLAETDETQVDADTPNSGEEVTRNREAYSYIVGNQLNLGKGVGLARYLARHDKLDFPIGATEVKAYWGKGAVAGAYTFQHPDGSYSSLLGLHIMMKMAPSPDDPFTSETPSWFWTTFEFNGNPGLQNARQLVTYPDVINEDVVRTIMQEAEMSDTPFATSYSPNGTQIRYSDSQHKDIILGNTKMENFAHIPKGGNVSPAEWTQWDVSCHSCHGKAAYNVESGKFTSVFPSNVGPLGSGNPGLEGYKSLDFVWAFITLGN